MKHIDTVMPKVIPKEASGKNKLQAGKDQVAADKASAGRDHIDAINQAFAELELAYHNQFHKAYAQEGALGLAKKYWLGVLAEYMPQVILRAVRQVVRSSEFLPSLAAIVSACENAYSQFGLPAAQAAYIEACCAAEPKAAFAWSHPAVYMAAELTGWYALKTETQMQIFPLFEYNYGLLCHRVLTGEKLHFPLVKALPEKIATPLSAEENLQKMQQLRKKFDL